MRALSAGCRLLTAVALVALAAGCHDRESGIPTAPSDGAGALQEVTVEISGPGRLALGESAQFSVTVRLPDSTISTPTTVKWVASPQTFLQVDASGRATAGSVSGGAAITVVVNSSTYAKQVSKAVVVVPSGTFFLTGTVSDAEFPTSRIVGARVEVTPGPPEEPTDVDGRYRLYGVPSNSTIRVTADGYEPLEQRLAIGGDATQNFLLTSSHPLPTLAGLYTLAIDVIDGCASSSPLSADLQHRRYDATVTQTGLTVDVLLTEPRFEINRNHGNHFRGHADPNGVTFTLGYYQDAWDWGVVPIYPDVAERLPNGTFLIVSGTAITAGSEAGWSGVLAGDLQKFDSRYPGEAFSLGACSRPRFTLTPR
jgi:hypothetical protein